MFSIKIFLGIVFKRTNNFNHNSAKKKKEIKKNVRKSSMPAIGVFAYVFNLHSLCPFQVIVVTLYILNTTLWFSINSYQFRQKIKVSYCTYPHPQYVVDMFFINFGFFSASFSLNVFWKWAKLSHTRKIPKLSPPYYPLGPWMYLWRRVYFTSDQF